MSRWRCTRDRRAGAGLGLAAGWYKVPGVFWPLIGGFIAFILFAVLMGWIMDAPSRSEHRRR
jgi:ABC-type Mn2+/Zn2+ transport system permease subunit